MISVIVPVHNDPAGLRQTIISLVNNNPELPKFEIIVGNDGAGKAEIEAVNELLPQIPNISMINIPVCSGSYAARNRCAEVATGEVLAFLDAGITVEKYWWKNMAANLVNSDYIAGAVDVPLAQAESSIETYNAISAFPIKTYFEKYHFGVTANLVVKKSVLDRVGNFDARLRSGGDMEFGDRVYRQGIPQSICPNATVKHPPRNFRQLKSKSLRVQLGVVDLIKFYPDRFDHLKNERPISSIFIKLAKQIIRVKKTKIYTVGKLSASKCLFVFFQLAYIKICTTISTRKASTSSI